MNHEVTNADEAEDDGVNLASRPTDVFDVFSGIDATQSPLEGWSLQGTSDSHTIFSKLVENQGVVSVMRAVTFRKDLPVVVSVGGKLVPEASYRSPSSTYVQLRLTILEKLRVLLSCVDFLKVCAGCPCEKIPTISTSKTAVRDGDVWHRKACLVLSEQTICRECRLTRKVLCEREKRNSSKPTTFQREPRVLVKNFRRKAIRATAFREKARGELRNLKRQLSEMSDEKIEAAISVLPCSQQVAFRRAVKGCLSKIRTGEAV